MAIHDAPTSVPHVVIVGGGFGGLEAAKALRRAPVRVTLVDRRNHHLFQPLLYQIATAALSPGDIASPIRAVLRRQRNTRVLLAEVVGVDLAARQVMLADGQALPYDDLILATGSRTAYFGHDAWAARAPGLKTIEDALEMRRRVLLAYEQAERELDPAARRRLLTFVVIGGGPTGVELAGALAEIARHTLRGDFRAIDPTTARGRVKLAFGLFIGQQHAPPHLQRILDRLQARSARRRLLTFVVIGGGPTGVELAGALAEIARHTLRGDFRAIDPTTARVILVESAPRVLMTFPERLSASAQRQLERLGVEVMTGNMVRELTDDQVVFDDGQRIEAATVLWAAGVTASPLVATLGLPTDRAGRVTVEPDLSLPGYPEVYVIGDLALFPHQGPRPLPGVAPVAMQQGRAAAANILRRVRGEPTRRFHYWNKGNVATIGRSAGVADFGWLRVSGFFAWLTWLFVHIWYLVGFENRIVVFTRWAWSYFTYQRSARLITGDPTRPRQSEATERVVVAGERGVTDEKKEE